MEHSDVATQSISNDVQIPIELSRGAKNNVVKCMPWGYMGVSNEPFKQESPNPGKTTIIIKNNCNEKDIIINLALNIYNFFLSI